MTGRVGRNVHRLELFAHPAPAALASGWAPLRAAGPASAGWAAPGSGRSGARPAKRARAPRGRAAASARAAIEPARGPGPRGTGRRTCGPALGGRGAGPRRAARRGRRVQAARRRRGRDGFARTRDGRGPRSEGPGRRGAGGRPLTSLPLRWRLFGRGLGFISDNTLGRGDAAARGDRHPGFGRALCRGGRGRRGLCHPWPIGAGPRRGPRRGPFMLLLIGLLGPQDGWALGRRGRRFPGRGGLVTDRLVIRLRGLRRCGFDHRRRGRRLQQTVALCPSPDAVGLGFNNA